MKPAVAHVFARAKTGAGPCTPWGGVKFRRSHPMDPTRLQYCDRLGRFNYRQWALMKRDLYAEVSARIVAELEAGATPWIKPWSATPGANTPCNAVSNRPYSGSNVVLLWIAQAAGYRTPRFLTFKQALELGGNVRKGEHGKGLFRQATAGPRPRRGR